MENQARLLADYNRFLALLDNHVNKLQNALKKELEKPKNTIVFYRINQKTFSIEACNVETGKKIPIYIIENILNDTCNNADHIKIAINFLNSEKLKTLVHNLTKISYNIMLELKKSYRNKKYFHYVKNIINCVPEYKKSKTNTYVTVHKIKKKVNQPINKIKYTNLLHNFVEGLKIFMQQEKEKINNGN